MTILLCGENQQTVPKTNNKCHAIVRVHHAYAINSHQAKYYIDMYQLPMMHKADIQGFRTSWCTTSDVIHRRRYCHVL